MKIGWIGLGKLGLVCAMTGEQFGSHEVLGYDPSELVTKILTTKKLPYQEEGKRKLLDRDLRIL
jgi:UDP-glucose 6-dehydrogenase